MLSKPKDFRYAELVVLLGYLGYQEIASGKTSGSRIAFWNEMSGRIIRLHRPHPVGIMKTYQLDQLLETLKEEGLL